MTKSLSLYAITAELETMLDNGIDEDGVISQELGGMLSKFEDKCSDVAAYILNRQLRKDSIDAVIKRLEKQAAAEEKAVDSLRKHLQDSMKKSGIYEISANDGTFKVKLHIERDASVEIFDERQIPFAFKKIPAPRSPEPDKIAIRDAIKNGVDVPGARIIKKDRLEIK